MTAVRLPRRLSDGARINASGLQIDLSCTDPPKATLTIPAGETTVDMHDLIELYTVYGSTGLYRVVSASTNYRQTLTAQLIGAIDTLTDDYYIGSTTLNNTAANVIRALLGRQTVTRWQLGRCALNKTISVDIKNQQLWSLIDGIRADNPGYYWSYDYTTTPWTLNLDALPMTVGSEFRITRNVESAQVQLSDADMCNRLYLSVDGASPTTYNNTAAQAKYGIICKTVSAKSEEMGGATAAAYAQAILAERAEPAAFIDISGQDLMALTGDDYDHIQPGQLCRAALEQWPAPLDERVMALSFPNAIKEPLKIKASLANQLRKISETLAVMASIAKGGGGGGGGGGGAGASEALERWAKVVTKMDEAVDGVGIPQMYQSGIEIDAEAGVRIFSLAQGFTSQYTEIKTNSQAITLEAQRATEAEGVLRSSITVNAQQIELRVKAGDIASSINQTAQSVRIQASKIDLDGYVTATQLRTQVTQANVIQAQGLTASSYMTIPAATTFDGRGVKWKSQTVVSSLSITMPKITTSVERYVVYTTKYNNTSKLYTGKGKWLTAYTPGVIKGPTTTTIYYMGR